MVSDFDASSTATPYEVNILGIPESGARSRTETQVRLIVRVLPRAHYPPIKWLVLPSHQLSSSRRSRATEEEEEHLHDHQEGGREDNVLYVRARCLYSDRDQPIYACYSCILRERKRGLRKRAKLDAQGDDYEPQVHIDTAERETEQDRERILIFASQSDRLQLMKGDVMVPIRLTCYCRHHEEKVGFRVRMELLDRNHQIMGVADSPPILITDDHKRVARHSKSIEPGLFDAPSLAPATPPRFPSATLVLSKEPHVLKVVPAEGPMHGGIEITVLGEGLTPESVILFGALPSTLVNFISSSTVVVRLPPSHVAGIVPVLVGGTGSSRLVNPDDLVIFNYKNDLDRAMMELALQLIGMKMTGRVDDARDIALRIISEFSPCPSASGGGVGGTACGDSRQVDGINSRLEQVLITCLAAAEATGGLRVSGDDVSRFRTVGGQTLLHLAALARFDHLFEYLGGFDDGILLATTDKNGFTPSDLYYLVGRQEFLETLGLDDSDDDEPSAHPGDIGERYRLILRRVSQRQAARTAATCSLSIWSAVGEVVARIRRRPARIRNHINRLRNVLWRKLTSEDSIKEYYLKSFGSHKEMAFQAGSFIYQSYQENKPVKGRTRDLLVWYFWVPILFAVLVVWYFDYGTNLASLCSTSEDVSTPLAATVIA